MKVRFGQLIAKYIVFGLMAVTVISAQSQNIGCQGGISIYPHPKNAPLVYVEFPFAVQRSDLIFLPEDSSNSSFLAGIYADVIISDTLGNAVDSAATYFLTRAANQLDIENKNTRLFNRLNLMLLPGMYSAILTVIDPVSKKEGTFRYNRIEIKPIETQKINISSLEFAHDIYFPDSSAAGSSNFRLEKNGRVVVPNPMGIYTPGDSILLIYGEIYNLNVNQNLQAADSVSVHYTLWSNDDSLLIDFGGNKSPKPGESMVLSSRLIIGHLPDGRYILRLIAEDLSIGARDTVITSFNIIPETGDIHSFAQVQSIDFYDTCSIETKMHLVKYIMDPHQLTMLKSMNDEARHRLIDQYFKDKDSNPQTAENEFLNNLIERYLFANEFFSMTPGKNDGWLSDRGRVLIQYGFWNDREEIIEPSVAYPIEGWTYLSSEGHRASIKEHYILFIFIDKYHNNEFRLVHSTASGEINQPDWKYIYRDQGGNPDFID